MEQLREAASLEDVRISHQQTEEEQNSENGKVRNSNLEFIFNLKNF